MYLKKETGKDVRR